MISSIVLVGHAGDNIDDKFRYIITEHQDSDIRKKPIISKIPCLYWTRNSCTALQNLKVGQFVIIRGHIEADEKNGLYVLVETIQLFA